MKRHLYHFRVSRITCRAPEDNAHAHFPLCNGALLPFCLSDWKQNAILQVVHSPEERFVFESSNRRKGKQILSTFYHSPFLKRHEYVSVEFHLSYFSEPSIKQKSKVETPLHILQTVTENEVFDFEQARRQNGSRRKGPCFTLC